jgi:SAM-dependent MidA family methyltransferase
LSSSSNKETGKTRSPSSTATTKIHPFGPVPQGEFLMKMGAGDLTMNAIEKDETTEEQAQAMADALKYLVMPEHMGTKFKVLALARKRDGLFAPPGME